MRWKLAAGALLGLLAFALLETAVEAEPNVQGVEVQAPAQVTIGDRFHYVITLDAQSGTKVGVTPGSLGAQFEQIGQPKIDSKSIGNGQSQITMDIEMAAFATGDVTIPPLSLDYEEPDGNRGSVMTPTGRLVVSSVLPADTNQLKLRDLKPQLEIGSDSLGRTLYAGMAVALLALAVVAILVARSMRKKPEPEPVGAEAELGPEDRARAILEAAGVAFGNDRDYVKYYGAIAVTIRNYLTERYGFHAFALTTMELRAEMGRRGIDRWQSRLIDGLLTQCDAAVYARYVPALERAGHDLNAAFEIIEMSRPKPEPEAEQPEAVAATR